MKTRFIAAVWVTGATVPLLLAAVFLAGCCVLPLHGLVHKLMPLCETAAQVVRGDHGTHHETESVPSTPARDKQSPVQVVVDRTATFRFWGVTTPRQVIGAPATPAYRDFITHGAVRCDCDVGLHVLVETFLI